jgi:hypothetical protein
LRRPNPCFSISSSRGAYRLIRWRRLREAKAVMNLFQAEEIRELHTPAKWAAVKLALYLGLAWVLKLPELSASAKHNKRSLAS